MVYGIFLQIAVFFVIVFKLVQLYNNNRIGWCKTQRCLIGKTAIVTGGNTGIGFETALDLAKRGARVIIACRNKHKGAGATGRLKSLTGNENVAWKLVNFASFESVRALADEVNASEERLDILVNNAGYYCFPRRVTEDGHRQILQVNYLSHFLLTNLLGNLLKRTPNSRVVNLASFVARFATVDLGKLNDKDTDFVQYRNAEACKILFTRELAKKLYRSGCKVTTYSVHPGFCTTELLRDATWWITTLYNHFYRFFCRSSEQGAQGVLYVAVTPEVVYYNGEHFTDCRKVEPYDNLDSAELASKLWVKSEEMVKLQPEEQQI